MTAGLLDLVSVVVERQSSADSVLGLADDGDDDDDEDDEAANTEAASDSEAEAATVTEDGDEDMVTQVRPAC